MVVMCTALLGSPCDCLVRPTKEELVAVIVNNPVLHGMDYQKEMQNTNGCLSFVYVLPLSVAYSKRWYLEVVSFPVQNIIVG